MEWIDLLTLDVFMGEMPTDPEDESMAGEEITVVIDPEKSPTNP